MDERYAHPLPVLSVDADYLHMETKGYGEERFRIKNTGGAVLSGHILSRSACISFEPSEWMGNDVSVTCRFNPDEAGGMKPGDIIETAAYICTNGGERKLPVTVKLINMAMVSPEERVIANVRDFYEYALEHPPGARRLFTDNDFYMLLLATGYGYMEAYEMLLKDLNRERAMDNFFILSGLKKKTVLTVQQPLLTFTRMDSQNDVIRGHFLVRRSDSGFVDAPVTALGGAGWLTLSAHRLISSDFNEANTAMVGFVIDPLFIGGRYAGEKVAVGTDGGNITEIVFKRGAPLSVRLAREAYRFDDRGSLFIENQTGGELLVELFCKDSFIRFEARRYMVGERYEIPFTVKLSAFISAQLLFRKLPFLRTTIEVKAIYREQLLKRQLDIIVGKW
jgi:hypothetical protein